MTTSDHVLTAEERLRNFAATSPDDRVAMANYEGDDIAADILATLDAAREPRLDANLMGRAIHKVFNHGHHGGGRDGGDGDLGHALVTEYARLAPTPGTDEVRVALAQIEKAEKVVDDLCQGRRRWEMNVPAQPDSDPDLVISEALRLARRALGGQ